MSAFFPSPGCPASRLGEGGGGGRLRKAPEHAWSPESGPGGNPCLQTPLPVKDVKKKKTCSAFLSPLPARPMAPPDCLRVGCAPSKWLPSSSAEPLGPGILDIGVGEGCRGRGGDGVIACLCGTWAVGACVGCACGGQNEPNEAEAGGVGGGLGSVCSLRLG